jgi:hypothetical protein
MYGAKGRCFSMDGKRRILIVSFFDCTQASSRKKHRKAGRIQEAFLMVLKAAMVLPSTAEPHQKQRFQAALLQFVRP